MCMFQALLCSSSGVQNCICSIWYHHTCARYGHLQVCNRFLYPLLRVAFLRVHSFHNSLHSQGLFSLILYLYSFSGCCNEFNNSPTRCDLFRLLNFCRQLYMFRVLTAIIRSWHNCNYLPYDTPESVPTQQREQMVVDPVNQYQKL